MLWANTKLTSSEKVDICWSECLPMLRDWIHIFADDGILKPQTHTTNEKLPNLHILDETFKR